MLLERRKEKGPKSVLISLWAQSYSDPRAAHFPQWIIFDAETASTLFIICLSCTLGLFLPVLQVDTWVTDDIFTFIQLGPKKDTKNGRIYTFQCTRGYAVIVSR